ncbi:RNA polymerase sigma factor [Bacillus sp. 31A1R]|uniref:RNA polymerase sigma factor n=1 Tax=Robertmurraya mangrovi TaxID=3098077 RepID=A0ABU5IWL5_9BACI|nr:RNA polymerase sigma factor [Bacillus sp. 31A1R]MDZ5471520.1 RNA polymerase sigma factor [Bacillus sp. 31A1R]
MSEIHNSIDMNDICEKYSKRLFQVAFCITRDHYLAQDVVQETLIKAYQKMDTVKEVEKLGSWLSSIATRTAIDFVRKEKRKNETMLEGSVLEDKNVHLIANQDVEKEVEVSLLKEEIGRVINGFSSDAKNIFLLKIKEGLKEKEIASKLHINEGTVKTKVYRARKQLKMELAEQYLA